MASAFSSVFKSLLGGKRKGAPVRTAGGATWQETMTAASTPTVPTLPMMPAYTSAPIYPPIYTPAVIPTAVTYGAPAATAPLMSPAASPVGLTAGGMALTTGAAFKAVLGLSDFRWIGLPPTHEEPEVSVEDGKGVSASWTADTEEQGEIELDIFSAAGRDPSSVLANILKEGEGTPKLIQFSGAEEAYEAQSDGYAWLAARRGALVFVFSIPSGPRASQQLGYLGGLVLHRVSAG